MAHRVAWSSRRTWSSQPDHVAEAREFVAGRLPAEGLEGHVDVVQLVVSELVTNAVVHAAGSFAVSVGREDDALALRVTDASPRAVPRPPRPPWDGPNGRGLQIVTRLSARWGVDLERDGKTVWARFDIAGPGLAAVSGKVGPLAVRVRGSEHDRWHLGTPPPSARGEDGGLAAVPG